MSTSTGTGFYVQKPNDEFWNTFLSNWVIEALPIDISDSSLKDWEKTDTYVRGKLKVINPKNFDWPHIDKSMWVKCSGPSRKLEFREYVKLYQSLNPEHPLPPKWEERKSFYD